LELTEETASGKDKRLEKAAKECRVNSPAVSVVMSVYNGEKYLRQAIDSILNQTYTDFEFIIIDDGSTDSTREIVRSYGDSRIQFVQNGGNIGLTKSLNKGLQIAEGRYVARMDADDLSSPYRLKTQMDFLEDHPDYAVVGTFLNIIDENSNYVQTAHKPVTDSMIREHVKHDNCIAHGSAMIRKSCLTDIGFYDESIERSQDYDLFLRLSEKYKMANIPQCLYMWRDHEDNVSTKHRNEQMHFVEMVKTRAQGRKETAGAHHARLRPQFSVLMANYSNGRYIGEAIQSVLDQTFRDWELVIVDDCSTDNSIEVIEPYLQDERVRLLKNNVNLGYIRTLNRLVYEARAEILGILDSDDALTSDAIEVMHGAHKLHPQCGFIYSQFASCDSELNLEAKGFCDSLKPGETTLRRDCVSAFRTFRKSDYFKTEGFAEEVLYAEDKDLTYKMEEVTQFLFIDRVLYKYRTLPLSQSNEPRAAQVGWSSSFLARYKAYKRRLNTNLPNLTPKEMSDRLFEAVFLSARANDIAKALYFLPRAIKLNPLNFRGYALLCSGALKLARNMFRTRKKKKQDSIISVVSSKNTGIIADRD